MSLYCVIWLLLNSVDTGGFDDDEDPDAAGAASCDDDDDDDDNDGGGGGDGDDVSVGYELVTRPTSSVLRPLYRIQFLSLMVT